MLCFLVSPRVSSLNVVDECRVDDFVSAGGGVVACEVPIATVVGAGLVQILHSLEYNLNLSVHALGRQHLCHFLRNLLHGERFVNILHAVDNLLFWQVLLLFASLIRLVDYILASCLLEKLYSRRKSAEVS